MKRKLIWICVISLVLMLASNATSAPNGAFKKGDNEIDFAASWTSQTYPAGGGTQSWTSIYGQLGHFLTNEVQLGVELSAMWTNPGTTTWGVGGYGKYHFQNVGTSKFLPYVGGFIKYEDWAGGLTGYDWGPLAGIKFLLSGTENVFVFAEYRYIKYQTKLDTAVTDAHNIFAGLGIKLP